MAALIGMLAWLPQVLPAMSELPPPVNLNLTSIHFSHVLKWEAGPGTPAGVYYHVSVKTVTGTSWVPVAGCKHVQHPLVCNLTEAFPDPNQIYFTRVKALLEAQDSQAVIYRGFKPISDTHLDLPRLTVTACGEDLCVDLQPPMEHLRGSYDSLQYKLRIKSSSADKAQLLEEDQRTFFMDIKSLKKVLKGVAPARLYCVSLCFSDRDVPRESNYSQPICALTPGHRTADPWIAAVLCLLAMSVLVVVALLVYTDSICLMRRPLPLVLTSVHHIEDMRIMPSCRQSFSSALLKLKPSLPSSGEKRNSQTSDESDRESVTEGTVWIRGGGYKIRVGHNLVSSSSSSSSSLAAPLSPGPEPSISMDTHSNAGLNDLLSTHTASRCDSLLLSDTDRRTTGAIHSNKEETMVVVREGGSEDVNLLTLTIGRLGKWEEAEEVEKSHFDSAEVESLSSSEVYNSTPSLSSHMRDGEEAAMGTVSCSVDEEEEEEPSGYMERPCADVTQNLG